MKYGAPCPLVVNSDGVSPSRWVEPNDSNDDYIGFFLLQFLKTLSRMTNWPWPKMTPAKQEWTFRVTRGPKLSWVRKLL